MFTLLVIIVQLVSIPLICFLIYVFIQLRRERKATEQLTKQMQASRRIYRLLETLDFEVVIQQIADTIPNELQFGIGVVAIVDEQKKTIRHIAASRTLEAKAAITMIKQSLNVQFDQIEVSIDDPNNLMSRAIREKKAFVTGNSYAVFCPFFTEQQSEVIQDTMGIKTTLIYPIFTKDTPLGIFIASTKKSQQEISSYELYVINDFVSVVGIALQNSQLYSSLKSAKNNLSSITQEVYKMNIQLHQLDKVKDDFVSIASHELRTPMTAIRSYVWMAINRSDIPLSDKLKKYLERTLISTERLINLVNDMLNISRIESGRIEVKPKSFTMESLITDVLYEVEAKAKEQKVAVIAKPAKIPPVFADSDKVHQVLLNLIGNALKFTPAGGSITINFYSDGQYVQTSVTDTGVGMARDDMAKLFTKFGRLDNSYVAAATSGGTGLGLFICKNLIELMGGKMNATSEGLGKGSTFNFTLPVATPTAIASNEKFRVAPTPGAVKGLEPVAL